MFRRSLQRKPKEPKQPKRVRSGRALKSAPLRVGTVIERGLRLVGITSERIEAYLGVKCGCKERRRKLNALSDLAWGILTLRVPLSEAVARFHELTGEPMPEASPPEPPGSPGTPESRSGESSESTPGTPT